jgi:hypothetical protein
MTLINLPCGIQGTLKNLEAGHSERIELDKRAAEERWQQQQAQEEKHQQAIRDIESKVADEKIRYEVTYICLLHGDFTSLTFLM